MTALIVLGAIAAYLAIGVRLGEIAAGPTAQRIVEHNATCRRGIVYPDLYKKSRGPIVAIVIVVAMLWPLAYPLALAVERLTFGAEVERDRVEADKASR